MSPIPSEWRVWERRGIVLLPLTGRVHPAGSLDRVVPLHSGSAAVHPVTLEGAPILGRMLMVSTPPCTG